MPTESTANHVFLLNKFMFLVLLFKPHFVKSQKVNIVTEQIMLVAGARVNLHLKY